MYQQRIAYLGVLAGAVVAVARDPNDAGIGAKVKSNLTSDETVKAAQIDVGVQKKVVTLSGTADTPAVKERAVAVARGTDGIADVVDQITVKGQGWGPGPGRGRGRGREMMEKGMTEGKGHRVDGKREWVRPLMHLIMLSAPNRAATERQSGSVLPLSPGDFLERHQGRWQGQAPMIESTSPAP